MKYFDPRNVQTLIAGNNQLTSGNFYFDPRPGTTFIAPKPDQYGNFSPYIIRGRGRHNWDLALIKNFKATERATIQFRGEAFNVWNHASFRNPNVNASSRDDATISDVGPRRLLQMGLKLVW